MHPINIIEYAIAGAVIFGLLLISFFLPRRWKRSGFIAAFVVFIFSLTFFVAKPYWLDWQIEKRSVQLDNYLDNRYPNESWKIEANDHRNYPQYHPYHLKVTFEGEPGFTYSYHIDRSGQVRQTGYYGSEENAYLEGNYIEEDDY